MLLIETDLCICSPLNFCEYQLHLWWILFSIPQDAEIARLQAKVSGYERALSAMRVAESFRHLHTASQVSPFKADISDHSPFLGLTPTLRRSNSDNTLDRTLSNENALNVVSAFAAPQGTTTSHFTMSQDGETVHITNQINNVRLHHTNDEEMKLDVISDSDMDTELLPDTLREVNQIDNIPSNMQKKPAVRTLIFKENGKKNLKDKKRTNSGGMQKQKVKVQFRDSASDSESSVHSNSSRQKTGAGQRKRASDQFQEEKENGEDSISGYG